MNADPKTLERIMRSIEGLPDARPVSKPDDNDARGLARELFSEFMEELEKHEKRRLFNRAVANCEEFNMENFLDSLVALPAEETTFSTLKNLAFNSPELALAKWEEMKAAARHDVANGWHAARTVAREAWDRACYLAIRDQFRKQWPPRSGVEAMLIDEMAQYETFRRILMADLVERRWRMYEKSGEEPTGPAVLQSVDRLQRLFHYALRTLLALRRTSLPIVVANSSQLKLGSGPQADACLDAPIETTTT